jgi:hypothetical protein
MFFAILGMFFTLRSLFFPYVTGRITKKEPMPRIGRSKLLKSPRDI